MSEYLESIVVTYICSGIHFWPDAPEPVKWLSFPHRHRFTVTMTLPVEHDNRAKEFFMVKAELRSFMRATFDYDSNEGIFHFGSQSCEQIALKVAKRFGASRVEVWEDGENAGVVNEAV